MQGLGLACEVESLTKIRCLIYHLGALGDALLAHIRADKLLTTISTQLHKALLRWRQKLPREMKRPQLNAVQKSLLIPSGAAFVLGGLFGGGGLALGFFAALAASPVIYWKDANQEKAKWQRVLTASLLSGSGMLLAFISAVIGAETVLKAVRPNAYKQYITSDSQEEIAAAAPPVEQAKWTFTATPGPGQPYKYVTHGTATVDKNTKTIEWYRDVYGDGKQKLHTRCLSNGDYQEYVYYTFLIPTTNGIWSTSFLRCNVSFSADNTQIQIQVVSPRDAEIQADEYLQETVQVKTSTARQPQSRR
jgi:hypothetical protein